jgi:hypothetical protein
MYHKNSFLDTHQRERWWEERTPKLVAGKARLAPVSGIAAHIPFATDQHRGCKLGRRSHRARTAVRPVGSVDFKRPLPCGTELAQASLGVTPARFPVAGRYRYTSPSRLGDGSLTSYSIEIQPDISATSDTNYNYILHVRSDRCTPD